ncbi:hypothetical protein ACQ5SO_20395 [Rhodovulum sp. DZ06]|uniref:hypothetical protein n=1 Tax=Rhodovulum sp. DZ06 TaxID=3425126 RepID=UPI003D34E890
MPLIQTRGDPMHLRVFFSAEPADPAIDLDDLARRMAATVHRPVNAAPYLRGAEMELPCRNGVIDEADAGDVAAQLARFGEALGREDGGGRVGVNIWITAAQAEDISGINLPSIVVNAAAALGADIDISLAVAPA